MKKIFAAFCTFLLLPTLASAELISITGLAQETPEAWIEEIDVNGKTISIDAPIYVPEVETLQVIDELQCTRRKSTDINRYR